MFFPKGLFEKPDLSSDKLCQWLGLPTIGYGEALLRWHNEISKLDDSKSLYREEPGNDELVELGHGIFVHNPILQKGNILEKKILKLLEYGPLDTLSIGKRIFPTINTTGKRYTTSILHRLAYNGVILHHQEDGMDVWELIHPEPVSPIIVPPIPPK